MSIYSLSPPKPDKTISLDQLASHNVASLIKPESGCYSWKVVSKRRPVYYVGRSSNLIKRINDYMIPSDVDRFFGTRCSELFDTILQNHGSDVCLDIYYSKSHTQTEVNLIQYLKPIYNRRYEGIICPRCNISPVVTNTVGTKYGCRTCGTIWNMVTTTDRKHLIKNGRIDDKLVKKAIKKTEIRKVFHRKHGNTETLPQAFKDRLAEIEQRREKMHNAIQHHLNKSNELLYTGAPQS